MKGASIPRLLILFALGPLVALLGAVAGERPDNWIEVRSPNFTVASNAGEKQARRVAGQFEQIRDVFRQAFPKIRVDMGKPVVVLAVKNENSMKLLLPGFWEQKGRVHPAGIYQPGEEKHYVVLRLDVAGENPYHALYHEYTHALLHLNFRSLPLWLDEGLAEFYGNTSIADKDVRTGKVDISHLLLLQQSKLIPVETLLQVEHDSPYYNEQDRASVFYAESWALVHYLLLDPDARKQQLLTHFLQAWTASDNQMEAARGSFGDLKQFGQRIESYARQQSFLIAVMKPSIQADEKSYESRPLPPAESLALRGDFLLHTGRMAEARAMLEEAIQQDTASAVAHESLGYYYFRKDEMEPAAKELRRAAELNSKSFLTYYFSAVLGLRQSKGMPEEWPKIEADLEKAVELNPNFAPAYANLATLYSRREDYQEKALAAARRATELEPGTVSYSLNLGYVLLNASRTDEARKLASRIVAAAKSQEEMAAATAFQRNVEQRAEMEAQLAARRTEEAAALKEAATSTRTDASKDAPPVLKHRASSKESSAAGSAGSGTAGNPAKGLVYDMRGKVTAVDCSHAPEVTFTLTLSTIHMNLHAEDLATITMRPGVNGAKKPAECAEWKGKTAKMFFHLTPEEEYDGELTRIQFF